LKAALLEIKHIKTFRIGAKKRNKTKVIFAPSPRGIWWA